MNFNKDKNDHVKMNALKHNMGEQFSEKTGVQNKKLHTSSKSRTLHPACVRHREDAFSFLQLH